MTRPIRSTLLTLAVLSWTSLAIAQTPPPKPDPTAPSAASSPHQRSSTSTEAAESPPTSETDPAAAATPHQKQATNGKMTPQQTQAMKDCMKKESAQNASLSKDDAKKACAEQMQKPR